MVVDSLLAHAECGPNDHRKDAPPFITPGTAHVICRHVSLLIMKSRLNGEFQSGFFYLFEPRWTLLSKNLFGDSFVTYRALRVGFIGTYGTATSPAPL